ncbi:MAG TPA: YciI family protein [Dongiaceae bacterium]
MSDDGQGMVDSLLVMEFADRKAADDFAANDPYAKAGLFQSVTITAFRKTFPQA